MSCKIRVYMKPSTSYHSYSHIIGDNNIQWLKKLIHKRSNFSCKPNYSSENKAKPVGICGDKGGYHAPWCAKYHTFNLLCWFDIDFRVGTTWCQFFLFSCALSVGSVLTVWEHHGIWQLLPSWSGGQPAHLSATRPFQMNYAYQIFIRDLPPKFTSSPVLYISMLVAWMR